MATVGPNRRHFDLNWQEKTKFRVDPGFYDAEVSLVMNLDAYKKLSPKQLTTCKSRCLFLEGENGIWATYTTDETARQAKAASRPFSFDAAQAKAFREKAYDIGWPVRSRPAPSMARK